MERRPPSLPLFVPEVKAVDSSLSAAGADTTGMILLLNGVVPGTAMNERVGRQIVMTKLKMNLYVSVTPSTGIDQVARILIVRDLQPNGTALAITDVLDAVTPWSQYNLSNQHRFVILSDKQYYLCNAAESGSGVVVKETIPVNSLVQYNSGTAGTVADIATNSLYYIALGNSALTQKAIVYGTLRLLYRDE